MEFTDKIIQLAAWSQSSQREVFGKTHAHEIGFMENSVPYEDVFLNGTEPAEYASNSFAKSRICVGTSIICLLGAFIVTILVGSFVISPSVGLVTAILIGRSFKKAF